MKKRNLASRLLAISICVSMVLLAVQLVPGNVNAKPVVDPMGGHHASPWVDYHGSCVDHLQPEWNLVQFFYDPIWVSFLSGFPYWASDICNYTMDANLQTWGNHLITAVAKWNPDQQLWITYTPGVYGNNFQILGSQSYNVHCQPQSGYTFPYWIPPTDVGGRVPKSYTVDIPGGYIGGNPANGFKLYYPAWYNSCHPSGGGGGGNGTAGHLHISDVVAMLKNPNGQPYSGGATIGMWNASYQGYMWYQIGGPFPGEGYYGFDANGGYLWGQWHSGFVIGCTNHAIIQCNNI